MEEAVDDNNEKTSLDLFQHALRNCSTLNYIICDNLYGSWVKVKINSIDSIQCFFRTCIYFIFAEWFNFYIKL